MKVPFYKHSLTSEDRARVDQVLQTPFLTTGPVTKDFEAKLASYLQVKEVVGVSSWTTGAFLVLKALGIQPGDEIITSPMSFIASANIILHAGAIPIFADVDPQTGNLDPAEVEKAITARTRAIIPVHLYGQMVDVQRFHDIAKKYNLFLIEDAAHAVESTYDNVRPGQVSHAACFSFYATKNLTCGEGGAIATNDSDLADKLRKMRLHGMSRGAADRYSQPYYQHYDMEMLGYKCNLSDIQSALLIGQLDRLENQLLARNQIAQQYDKQLKGIVQLPQVKAKAKTAHHLYTIWVDTGVRDQFLKCLNDQEIGVAVNFRAIHLMSYFKKTFGFHRGQYPNAEKIGDQTITLPLYPSMTQEEVDAVISSVKVAASQLSADV